MIDDMTQEEIDAIALDLDIAENRYYIIKEEIERIAN